MTDAQETWEGLMCVHRRAVEHRRRQERLLNDVSESLAARLRRWNRRTAVHGPHTDGVGTYSNQSKATVSSVAYMPITRPVKPQATSVDR